MVDTTHVDRLTLLKDFGPKDKLLKTLNCDILYLVNTRDPENYTLFSGTYLRRPQNEVPRDNSGRCCSQSFERGEAGIETSPKMVPSGSLLVQEAK